MDLSRPPSAVSASRSTVYTLFRAQATWQPNAPALDYGPRSWTYGQLLDSVDRLASTLRRLGVRKGDRIAVLAENRPEYTQIQLAAARIGAIVACLNWRLTTHELIESVQLVEPGHLFFSDRFQERADALSAVIPLVALNVGALFGSLSESPADEADPIDDPECGLLLLYTSGTTGAPKAALISQRAEIARMMVLRTDLRIDSSDAYLAWSPMFHMGGTEHTLASLMFGARVIITDGLDLDAMIDVVRQHRLGWLLLVPATLEPLLAKLHETGADVAGVKVIGCMADLVPPHVIQQATRIFRAPFLNSFGSTETGLPPATGHLIPAGELPHDLAKRLSSYCEFRIVDERGGDVAEGETGEGVMRGPTLFTGYWNADDTNARDFRDGWFHMGDLFRRTPAGGLEFAGRSKYLIKSGGENIYPAEIERVLLSDSRVTDAAVVRKPDATWGEIPVAFVATDDRSITVAEILALCGGRLASYKRPKQVVFISPADLPRSVSGKIQREELELRLLDPKR